MTLFVFGNNIATTLGSALATGATVMTVSTGTGATFGPIPAGDVQAVTLLNTTTLATEIVYATSISGDVLTILRRQEGTTSPTTWPVGTTVISGPTAGQMANFLQAGQARTLLLNDTTFYVDCNAGSNSNNGLTSGTAWLTINYALTYIASNYDLGGNAITIQMANGTTYAPFRMTQEFTGGGSVTLQGNSGNSTLTAIAASAGVAAARVSAGSLSMLYVTVGGGTYGLLADGTGTLSADTMSLNASSVAHAESAVSGTLVLSTAVNIFGAAPALVQKLQGNVYIAGLAVTFSANVNFSEALLAALEPGTIFAQGITYTGTSTGAYYLATYGGYINTNGAASPSGFSAGSTGTAPNQGYFS
jgi:hypothetical protein